MLVRFDGDDIRGPSANIWHGVVDFVRGSLASALGQHDFEDFAPYTGPRGAGAEGDQGGTQVSALGEDPDVTLTTDRYGIVNFTEGAAANECVAFARNIWYDLQASPVTCIGARVEIVADADSPIGFVGFSDQADPDDVFAAAVINSGNNEDAIGFRINADETIDLVAVDDGTLTVLKDDIGVTWARTDGLTRFELRIEKQTSTIYRLTPCIDGVVARAGIVNVAATSLPENPMRPVVALTVSATTDPEFECDWIFSAQR